MKYCTREGNTWLAVAAEVKLAPCLPRSRFRLLTRCTKVYIAKSERVTAKKCKKAQACFRSEICGTKKQYSSAFVLLDRLDSEELFKKLLLVLLCFVNAFMRNLRMSLRTQKTVQSRAPSCDTTFFTHNACCRKETKVLLWQLCFFKIYNIILL